METMDAAPCSFCEWYHKLKELEEYYIGKRDDRPGVTEVRYGAVLVHQTFYDGQYCGRSAYEVEPLNYCPTCGIKLENK